MSITYRTYQLRMVDDKHWKASVYGPYNIVELHPRTEKPHIYDDWGYIATTDIDLNNAGKHLKLLADAILDSTAKEIHALKVQIAILEKQYKAYEEEFEDIDRLVDTMNIEEGYTDD